MTRVREPTDARTIRHRPLADRAPPAARAGFLAARGAGVTQGGGIVLDGEGLTARALEALARGARVAPAPAGLARMEAAHAVLLRRIAGDAAIYGVSTGLGPQVTERLDPEAQAAMSLATIRGRAHAVGAPLPAGWVRGALAVRLNTMLRGASGVRPALAHHIARCLNAGLVPAVGRTGTIGAADLPWGAAIGLALIGEGRMLTGTGTEPAADALARAGIAPFVPGPREGLALVANACPTAAIAALGLAAAERSLAAAQTAAALTMEGFRANPGQIRADVLALRPQPGQEAAGAELRARLAGSTLWQADGPRRLQDPLSIRHAVQVLGAVRAALDGLDAALAPELNGAPDSPAVLVGAGEVLSQGGYLTPHLTVALVAVNQALMQQAAQTVARVAKMLASRFTDLPRGLGDGASGTAGLGPVLKTAEALFAEIAAKAQPPTVYPSISADGLEDTVTHTAIPAMALHEILARLDALIAIELIAAAQAVELRGLAEAIAPPLVPAMAAVRAVSPPFAADRPLGDEIDTLAGQVAGGAFDRPA